MKKMLFGLLISLLILSSVFADYNDSGYHMFGMGCGGWFYNPLMMFLIWGGIIALAVLLIRNVNQIEIKARKH